LIVDCVYVYYVFLLCMWNFNRFPIVEKIKERRRERIAIIKKNTSFNNIASTRLLCWNRRCDNRNSLSTKLIIMILLWQRGWLEWKFRNLPENVVLWYVSKIILLLSIIKVVSKKFNLLSWPTSMINCNLIKN